jgi:DNA-directed RNA polymerase subunit RPC12/RpoP
MTPTELHTYQCSNCRTIATTTLRMKVNCPGCRRIMRYLATDPITTDRERGWAAQGVVHSPQFRTCAVCGQLLNGLTKIRLADGSGSVCSPACGLRHAASLTTHDEGAEQ